MSCGRILSEIPRECIRNFLHTGAEFLKNVGVKGVGVMMIRITDIEWIDEDMGEALIHLSDGEHSIVVFVDGFGEFKPQVGALFKETLYGMLSTDIVKVSDEKESVLSLGGFEQEIVGTVMRKRTGLLRVGQFMIEVNSDIPKDIVVGNQVKCTVSRIDQF